MSSASFVDGFGPIPRSRRHRTTLRSMSETGIESQRGPLYAPSCGRAPAPGAGRGCA
jgi:hypothetical protein